MKKHSNTCDQSKQQSIWSHWMQYNVHIKDNSCIQHTWWMAICFWLNRKISELLKWNERSEEWKLRNIYRKSEVELYCSLQSIMRRREDCGEKNRKRQYFQCSFLFNVRNDSKDSNPFAIFYSIIMKYSSLNQMCVCVCVRCTECEFAFI